MAHRSELTLLDPLTSKIDRADRRPQRPKSAAPELNLAAVRRATAPPWIATASYHEPMVSTNQTQFVQHACAHRPPSGCRFRPPSASVQPIWQTESLNAPLPSTTSSSAYTYHGRIQQQKPSRPPTNPAPYTYEGSDVATIPTSTTARAFFLSSLRATRQQPCKPHQNPPLFSFVEAGAGKTRSTSTDAFQHHGVVVKRSAYRPGFNNPPPYTCTESFGAITRSTSTEAFVDFGRAQRQRPIRPRSNPPPF